jgi:hypothetical protein
MENETSFDLNLAIQRWRENLSQSAAFRSENLNELVSHLRDSIATLQSSGLSEEESFLIASRRIGGDRQLEREFGKVNGRAVWLDRILWALIGVQVWGVVSRVTGSVATMALAFGWKATNYDYRVNGLALPVILSTLTQLIGMGASLAFCWWLIARKAPRLASVMQPFLKRRSTLAGCCAAFCVIRFLVDFLGSGPVLLMRRYGPASMDIVMTPLNVSQIITFSIQIITMVVITLWLARKRLRARPV